MQQNLLIALEENYMEFLKEFANASQINIPTFAKTKNIPIPHISTFYF